MSETIISDKNGAEKLLYVNSANELLFTVKGEKTEVIYKNVSSDFDVAAEENGAINVAIVSLAGALLYFRFYSGEWKKYIVLDSRGGGKKINGVRLLKINGRIHAFYCIEYEGRMMLIHHIFEGTDFSLEPHVVDYVSLRCAYSVCTDDSFNIHILYAGEDSRLKYIIFLNSQKKYSAQGIEIYDEIRGINSVCVGDRLYAAYLSREREYNVINCMAAGVGEKHTVGFGVDALSEPCIFSDGSNLYVQWCEKGYAFECTADKAFKFKKPQSLGQCSGILRLRSTQNESISCIDKCAGTPGKNPMPSARKVFDKASEKSQPVFEEAGAQVQRFADKYKNSFFNVQSFGTDYDFDERLCAIERQVGELVKLAYEIKSSRSEYNSKHLPVLGDVGEIDEQNLKTFNNLDTSLKKEESDVTNVQENEYNEISKEEL